MPVTPALLRQRTANHLLRGGEPPHVLQATRSDESVELPPPRIAAPAAANDTTLAGLPSAAAEEHTLTAAERLWAATAEDVMADRLSAASVSADTSSAAEPAHFVFPDFSTEHRHGPPPRLHVAVWDAPQG